MKDKYIDEAYGFWFLFGGPTQPLDLDEVSLASSDGFDWQGRGLAKDVKPLIEEHSKVQRRLVETAQAFCAANPEAFRAFWYRAVATP